MFLPWWSELYWHAEEAPMEELAWFVVGGAVGLWPPTRRRVIPVSKALVVAGVGIAKATVNGMMEIAHAVVSGEEQTAGTEVSPSVEETTVTPVSPRPARARRTVKTA